MTKRKRRAGARPRLRFLGCALTVALMSAGGTALGGALSQGGLAEGKASGFGKSGPGGESVILEVPCIDQRDKYPTGCESVTAVMALRYAGVDVSVEEFIDCYLPVSETPIYDGGGYLCADPNEAFLGSPYSPEGWGCYAPVIKTAAEKLVADKKVNLAVADLSGKALEKLCGEHIAQGVPVILWSTMYMAEPQRRTTITVIGGGRQTEWVSPEHCLLLVGMDEQSYWFNDPLEGKTVSYEKAAVERAYAAMGSQALAVARP